MANAGAQIHFWGQSGEKSELSLGKAVRILKAWEDGSALMFLCSSLPQICAPDPSPRAVIHGFWWFQPRLVLLTDFFLYTPFLHTPLAVGWFFSSELPPCPASLNWNHCWAPVTKLWTEGADNLQQTGGENTRKKWPLTLSHMDRDCEEKLSFSKKIPLTARASEGHWKLPMCRTTKPRSLKLMHCSLLSLSFTCIISLRKSYFQGIIPFSLLTNRSWQNEFANIYFQSCGKINGSIFNFSKRLVFLFPSFPLCLTAKSGLIGSHGAHLCGWEVFAAL